jgi:hypothetical protein
VTPGKLLTAEQSVRLAIVDSLDREQLIAVIVEGLREAVRQGQSSDGGACPFAFYSRPLPGDSRTNGGRRSLLV